jgi:DoxX-like family
MPAIASDAQPIEIPRRDTPSRQARIGYWACTLFVALTALGAGMIDVLHLQPLFGMLLHLGYPSYFATILGVWKVLGAAVLLAPRHPLLKEWAYAGMVIDYSSAVVSHWASGDGLGAMAGPIVAMVALAGSWYLRPPSRRVSLSIW